MHLDLTRMPLTFDSVCLRCAGAWDSYSAANITTYMNDIGLGFCDFFYDDDSNEVCATYYGLLFAWPLILIFGATIIVRSVQKSLPNLSSLLSLTLRLSLTLSLSLSLFLSLSLSVSFYFIVLYICLCL